MSKQQKYYVVWKGHVPGIYDSWAECQLQIKAYPDARYKSYPTKAEAERAFKSGPGGGKPASAAVKSGKAAINWDSIAVDAACSGNPGVMEYQGVITKTGKQIFHQKFDFYATIFEYLIKDYNTNSGGKYAEYFTPHAVAKIMAAILVNEPVQDVTVYDPSAGSGTLLMNIAHAIGEDKCTIYSQDISQKSSSLLRLNLILNNLVHSIQNIIQGNTISHPYHKDENGALVGYDKNLGTEVDLSLGYAISPSATIKAGYSQMFATSSMGLLKGGNSENTNNWAWVMIDLTPTFFKSEK